MAPKSQVRYELAAGGRWIRTLGPPVDGGISRLEWLGAVPSGKGPTSLEAQIEKVGF
jgi:hypothetical protein